MLSLSRRIEHYWTKVSPPDDNGCRHWLGHMNGNGYGLIKVNYRDMPAHRFTWLTFAGPIPEGLFVCHRCDVRSCVELSHLWLGTAKENTQDAIAKGRMHYGTRTGPAKLTEEQVREIRAKYVPRRYTTGMLAKEYGMSQHAVYAIVSGQTWRHLL